MRKRMLLIAAPICVVVLAAGVAFAAPGGGEHARTARLDHPHAVRPIAASPADTYPVAFEFLPQAMQRVAEYVQAVQLQEIATFVESVIAEENARAQAEAEARAAAEAAARAEAEAAAARQVVRSAPSTSSVNGGFLACVKQRESGGNYAIHNTGGSGASGAYQFMPSTWNSIARSVGRNDLVGVDPAAASPSDQDALAAALYQQQGAAPWGGGC
jgi:soluble lytic murein transglycosylase-like protein